MGGPIKTTIPNLPFSVTGKATIFGLQYNGRPDPEDNGKGFYGYNTHEPTLIGCSLPIVVLARSIGDDEAIRRREYTVSVQSHVTGRIVTKIPIVDKGPAAWTGNAIDCTFGLKRQLGETDNSVVTYWITGPKGVVQIKGWDFAEHKAV